MCVGTVFDTMIEARRRTLIGSGRICERRTHGCWVATTLLATVFFTYLVPHHGSQLSLPHCEIFETGAIGALLSLISCSIQSLRK